ncbi:TPA: hypothetical protein ACGPA6_001725 [Streptococcus suis]
MKIIIFFLVIIFVHLLCILSDRNYIKYLLFKLFVHISPAAQEEFFAQIEQIRPQNIRGWFIDEDDKVLFQTKFIVVYRIPLIWCVIYVVGYFIAPSHNFLILYTILVSLFAISYKYLEIYSLRALKRTKELRSSRFKFKGQFLLLHLGSVISFVFIFIGLYNLFFRGHFFMVSPFLSAVSSYLLMLLGCCVQDYFIQRAVILYDKEYSFEEIRESKKKIILFLRPFSMDDVSLYCPTYMAGGFLRYLLFPKIKFSLFLTNALEGSGQGFVVGIANPEEKIKGQRFHGFSKTFVMDDFEGEDKWKKEIAYLLDRAYFIVSIAGRTEGVRWEIETLKSKAHMEKAIILFSPKDGSEGNADLISRVSNQIGITSEFFPSEFYDSQFVGVHIKPYGPIWYLNYGRDYYSYIFSFLSLEGTIQNSKDFFRERE